MAELVSQLRANLAHGLGAEEAENLLQALEDQVLVPRGLYLDGGLADLGEDSGLSAEIVGLVVRADGRDLTELELKRVAAWLGARAEITEFSMSPLKPADSPEFLSE